MTEKFHQIVLMNVSVINIAWHRLLKAYGHYKMRATTKLDKENVYVVRLAIVINLQN